MDRPSRRYRPQRRQRAGAVHNLAETPWFPILATVFWTAADLCRFSLDQGSAWASALTSAATFSRGSYGRSRETMVRNLGVLSPGSCKLAASSPGSQSLGSKAALVVL